MPDIRLSPPKEQPLVSVDMVVFTVQDGQFQVALIKRKFEPFRGKWALPGGMVRLNESLEAAAKRELEEETGVKNVFLEQLFTFGEPSRDPRGRVISVAYYALLATNNISRLRATEDAAEAKWFTVKSAPPLAFDHDVILQTAVARLQSKLEYSTIARSLLPEKFRLSELQLIYETILGHPVDKRNFRKKILSLGILQPTGEQYKAAHRPAALYRFKGEGIHFFA